MNIFDTIPDNFFSILASPNKSIYYTAIVESFKVYEDASILGVDKRLIVDVIAETLGKQTFSVEDEEDEVNDNQARANYIIRKLEAHGWIDVDVTNDYEEILNFRDYSITVIEALMKINYTFDDYEFNDIEIEFKGYIYTIYSLLSNADNVDYALLIDGVCRNTKSFLRELRKLDSRLKDYIRSIVDTVEIKDLMENLIKYKVELFDKIYQRLKTSDNVNKYRLFIVNKLEEIIDDPDTINLMTISTMNGKSYEATQQKIIRNLTDVIDVFNELDNYITEIDIKNKTYVNATIGKVQFLLKEDFDVSGKITYILRYVSEMYKNDKIDTAMRQISKIHDLATVKGLHQNSLYSPRGSYRKIEPNKIDLTENSFDGLHDSFLKEYSSLYSEKLVLEFIDEVMSSGGFKASNIIKYDSPTTEILMVLFALIYSDQENHLVVNKLDNEINHCQYILKDFEIVKEEKSDV